VPLDHLAHVANREVLPAIFADVLPAGDLFEHQQSDLVASVEKRRRLRIMRCPDDVALELAPEDVGVAALDARGHGSSDKWKCLMAIEAPQFHMLPVQHESGGREPRGAETDAGRVFVMRAVRMGQSYAYLIELRMLQVPQFNVAG